MIKSVGSRSDQNSVLIGQISGAVLLYRLKLMCIRAWAHVYVNRHRENTSRQKPQFKNKKKNKKSTLANSITGRRISKPSECQILYRTNIKNYREYIFSVLKQCLCASDRKRGKKYALIWKMATKNNQVTQSAHEHS